MADSFKICLDDGLGEKEVFAVKPKGFDSLMDEIYARKPELRNKSLKCYYEDSDGDKITITKATDFELFLEQNISKMNVEVIEGTAWKSMPTESAAPPRSNDEIRSIHHEGILCDVCDKDVYGFRYKCLDCEEFDMCMDCQTTQIHKEHLLLRITNPIDGEKNFELRVVPGENNPEYE